MEPINKIIIGALLALPAISTFANEGHFSGEILLGKTDQVLTSNGDFTNDFTIGGDDTSWGIRGAYHIDKNPVFELSYISLGETDETFIDGFNNTRNEKISSSAINLGFKGSIPFENGFSIHGRAGLSFWDVEQSKTNSFFPGRTFTEDHSGNDFYYGIGAQYLISEKISVGFEYTLFEYGIDSELEIDVEMYALTAGFNF